MLLAVAGALALRVPGLDARPMHNDEGVNAGKLRDLWQDGRYAYDPHEFHGPTLHYSALPFLWPGPARTFPQLNETTLRLVTVAFGTGLIVLLIPLADGLGRSAVGWAAVFTAVSPAMVFYSRYFIHETLLVFFTALTLGAGWRYCRERRAHWAVLTGMGIGLMFATKETFVIALAAMALAALATRLWTKRFEEGQSLPIVLANRNHLALAGLAGAAVWLTLFSSFFTNVEGPADSILTYLPWLRRAGGESQHIHPWYFYLERLLFFHRAKGAFWSEGLILVLALVGAGAAFFNRKMALSRFLTFYTLFLAIAYCAIPYKTPWCMLGFLHGLILLAGIGAAALIDLFRQQAGRAVTIALLTVATGHLAWQARSAGFVYSADPTNPYVYAQTVPDILRLVQRAEEIAGIHPRGRELVVKVMAPAHDYGPLPWYLRGFRRVGWWSYLPPDPYAPLVIVAAQLDARLDEKSDNAYLMTGLYELRPGIFMELYVETELWRRYVESGAAGREP